MSTFATRKRRRLTAEEEAAIERTHRILDEIARELRARQNSHRAAVPRKESA